MISAGGAPAARLLRSACRWICSREAGCRGPQWATGRPGPWWVKVPRVLGVGVGGGRRVLPGFAFSARPGDTTIRPTPNYLFACPRTNFFTFRFCEPRAYSRGFNGCSSLRFLRAARFVFLRSSLLRAVVLAMIAFKCPIFVPGNSLMYHA